MKQECSWCGIKISKLRAATRLIDKLCKECTGRSNVGGSLGPKYSKGSRRGQK